MAQTVKLHIKKPEGARVTVTMNVAMPKQRRKPRVTAHKSHMEVNPVAVGAAKNKY